MFRFTVFLLLFVLAACGTTLPMGPAGQVIVEGQPPPEGTPQIQMVVTLEVTPTAAPRCGDVDLLRYLAQLLAQQVIRIFIVQEGLVAAPWELQPLLTKQAGYKSPGGFTLADEIDDQRKQLEQGRCTNMDDESWDDHYWQRHDGRFSGDDDVLMWATSRGLTIDSPLSDLFRFALAEVIAWAP